MTAPETCEVEEPGYGSVAAPMEFALIRPEMRKDGTMGKAVFDPAAAVEYLKRRHVVWHERRGQFYVYDSIRTHLYNPIGDGISAISALIHNAVDECTQMLKIAPLLVTTTTISNIIGKLKSVSTVEEIEPEEGFDPEPYASTPEWDELVDTERDWEGATDHLVPFRNGVLNLATMDLLPFTASIFLTGAVNVDYVPSSAATGTLYEIILRKMFPDADTLNVFLQYIGYTLYTRRVTGRTAAFLIVYGSGGDGKSMLGRMVTDLLGQENVTTLNMDQLTRKFSCYQLGTARANICQDTSLRNASDTDIDTSTLKSLCVGDSITVERKFMNPYTMVCPAKLLFFANDVPDLGEVDEAVARRLLIIHLPGIFKPKDSDYRVMTSRKGLEWFAAKCFDAFCEFAMNGMKFNLTSHMKNEVENYKLRDTKYAFFYDMYDTTDRLQIAMALDGEAPTDVYDLYKNWYNQNSGRAFGSMMGRNNFYRAITAMFGVRVERSHSRTNGYSKSESYFKMV